MILSVPLSAQNSSKDIVISKEAHEKLKMEISELDRIRGELENKVEENHTLNVELQDLRDSIAVYKDKITEYITSMQKQVGILEYEILKNKSEHKKLLEKNAKITKVLDGYKQRQAELIQENTKIKVARRKQALSSRNSRLMIWVALSGWITAIIIGITNR